MNQIFKDTELNAKFMKDGFVTIPLINEKEIQKLIECYYTLHPESNSGFYASLFSSESEKKKISDQSIREIIEQKSLELLNNFQSVVANFVIKYPGKESVVYPHQDWCFVDEETDCSINVWIPLTLTSYQSGSLHLLRNSHQLPRTYRGANVPSAIEAIATNIDFKDLHEVNVEPGCAVFYDHRMIHASPANLSNEVRIAVVMAVMSKSSVLRHYVKENNNLYCYQIDRDFFYKFTYAKEYNNLFAEYKLIDSFEFNDIRFPLKQLIPSKGFWHNLFSKRKK